VIEVIALAGALPHPGEHGVTAVRLGNVVDELHDHDRLADARAAKRAHLAALEERADEIDDLDAGLENVGLGLLLDQRRGRAVNRVALGVRDRTLVVDGVARDVEDAAEHALAHRHRNRLARIRDFHAALEALGRGHGDGAGHAGAEVLLDFEREALRPAGGGELDHERLIDGRDGVFGELHVDDGADDLEDLAGVHLKD
jgi:hypothetical protein